MVAMSPTRLPTRPRPIGEVVEISPFDTSDSSLVTSEESDVSKGLISTTSPIGRGLVGKRVGEVATIVTPNGKRELEILKLTTIHDESGKDESPDDAVKERQ